MANIDNIGANSQVPNNKTQAVKPEQTDKLQTQEQAQIQSTSDAFSLSEQATALTKIKEQATDSPFDSSKIEAIKSAIENGQFKVDKARLAQSMINHEQDFNDLG